MADKILELTYEEVAQIDLAITYRIQDIKKFISICEHQDLKTNFDRENEQIITLEAVLQKIQTP